ncbi:hypothetical protein KFL_000060600 [Klebsormidium nitens]|uniref:Carrier domain-containing protein n=1 Tax=Klebsormidium nitens TaxID=105231 RepID=A0A0U9HI43_KLENI|nr:hypothetical protein KFL_000060600 [Klebsormidium nitens]|eukprot:GAQ77994.1 hypothetical protein KFL_000060600 [Klebsormidium nitens]
MERWGAQSSLLDVFSAAPETPTCLITDREPFSSGEVQAAAATLSADLSKNLLSHDITPQGLGNSEQKASRGDDEGQSEGQHSLEHQDSVSNDRRASQGHVALFLERSPAYIVSLLAVSATGAAFVPIDPSWPPGKVQLILSGSTGQPKGVCGTLGGLLNRLCWMAEAQPYQLDDVCCFKTGVGFIDHLTELLGPMLAGVPVVIPSAVVLRESPLSLVDCIQERCITRLVAVPSFLRMLLSSFDPHLLSEQLSLLRLVVSSGEALSWDLARRLQKALPHATILNLYGSTEVTGDVLSFNVTQQLLKADLVTSSCTVPIGQPILNHRAMLIKDNEEEVTVDEEVGELCVSGPGLCSGYLHSQEASRDAFFLCKRNGTAESTADGPEAERFYRTGDLATRLLDGNYAWVGRRDRQFKVRGHRVQLEEVEAALRNCPLVQSAAVKAWPLPSQELGLAAYVTLTSKPPQSQVGSREIQEQSFQLVSEPPVDLPLSMAPPADASGTPEVPRSGPTEGLVLHRPADPLAEREQQTVVSILREHLRGRLLPAAVPALVEVVPAIPLTASGKVDYAALLPPASFQSPLPLPLPQGESDSMHEGFAGTREESPGVTDCLTLSPSNELSNPRVNAGAKGLRLEGLADGAGQLSQRVRAAVLGAFRKALGVRQVAADADFFAAGGSSVTAAEVAHSLRVDMRWVYSHPTPESLAEALLKSGVNSRQTGEPEEWQAETLQSQERGRIEGSRLMGSAEREREDEATAPGRELPGDGKAALDDVTFWDSDEESGQPEEPVRERMAGFKSDAGAAKGAAEAGTLALDDSEADSASVALRSVPKFWEDVIEARGPFSLTRCNRVEMLLGPRLGSEGTAREKRTAAANGTSERTEDTRQARPVVQEHSLSPGGSSRSFKLHVAWRTKLGLCVDASPLLLVAPGKAPRLFIGSHAHNFKCLDAATGVTVWEREVGGRVEATAGSTRDGEKLVVGCYDGKIYVMNASDGSIDWTFQTGGEVKCQAVTDPWAGFVWCGSHDHQMYVLDLAAKTAVFRHDCGGSVYGAAAFDAGRGRAYVVTTRGVVTAFDGRNFQIVWTLDLASPLFASPAVTPSGSLICASVDGNVTALVPSGGITWRSRMGGPVFAGPCLSAALNGQALICGRDGYVRGLDAETGAQLWELEPDVKWVGEPITASAAVDETVAIHTDGSMCLGSGGVGCKHVYRLVWVCGSEGTVKALAVRARGTSLEQSIFLHGNELKSSSTLPEEHYRRDSRDSVQDRSSKRQHTETGASGSVKSSARSYHVRVLAAGKLPGEIFSSPVGIGGSMYVGCRDDNVYAVDLIG